MVWAPFSTTAVDCTSSLSYPQVASTRRHYRISRVAIASWGLPAVIILWAGAAAGSADPYCEAPLTAGSGAGGADTVLALAIVVARHGDRTPASILPDEGAISWDGCGKSRTDTVPASKAPFTGFAYTAAPAANPYANGMWRGDCADGQLTAKGAQQHVTLGASLRSRWIDTFALLDAMPEASLLSLRSTDIPRTRESAENMIASIFPNGIAGGGPIPLTRRPFVVEDMLSNSKKCPRFAEASWPNMGMYPWLHCRGHALKFVLICLVALRLLALLQTN